MTSNLDTFFFMWTHFPYQNICLVKHRAFLLYLLTLFCVFHHNSVYSMEITIFGAWILVINPILPTRRYLWIGGCPPYRQSFRDRYINLNKKYFSKFKCTSGAIVVIVLWMSAFYSYIFTIFFFLIYKNNTKHMTTLQFEVYLY